MITLKHLTIFKEVARLKSMSKAAETLYISQPTISQKIQEIENYYDIKLFQRYSKHLGISEEGKIFLEHANRILSEMDAMDDTFFHKKEEISLRLGLTLTVASTFAPQLIANLQEKNPTLHIHVHVDNTQSIEAQLLENELDIAIVEGDIHNDNIIHEAIIPDRLALVCNKDHELADKDIIHPTDLYNQNFICREKGSGTRAMLEQFMNLYKTPYHICWQSTSWESIKQAVLHNLGLTLMSVRLIQKEIEAGDLKVLNIEDWSWSRKFSLCYHKNKEWNNNLDLVKQEAIHYVHCPLLDSLRTKG